MVCQKQGPESKTYLTGASEDKGIDEPEPCTDLPIWSNITTNYSHWLSFILLMIVAVIINPSFLSVTNLTNQFVQGAIVGICAMGYHIQRPLPGLYP